MLIAKSVENGNRYQRSQSFYVHKNTYNCPSKRLNLDVSSSHFHLLCLVLLIEISIDIKDESIAIRLDNLIYITDNLVFLEQYFFITD